jgi:hypothetical protein
MIATQPPDTAQNPDRQGGDSGLHHTTILDHFRRSGCEVPELVLEVPELILKEGVILQCTISIHFALI